MANIKRLAIALLICACLAVLAVSIPAPVKKLGLFSFGLGMVVAIVLREVAARLHTPSLPGGPWPIMLLAGLTETGRIAETYRRFLHLQHLALQRKLDEAPGMAAILTEQLQQQVHTGWFEFLALRYQSIPGMQASSLTPLAVSGCLLLEISLAAGGAALAWRLGNIRPSSASSAAESAE